MRVIQKYELFYLTSNKTNRGFGTNSDSKIINFKMVIINSDSEIINFKMVIM